ncbi:MAG: hypothetical protein K0R69_318 [Clostridia bacterium]|jgi:hypothetical protein|nr:hypothetical protein [Clostridia bacterium]
MGFDLSLISLPYENLIILIGILHMTEGVLIILDAKKNNECAITYKGNKLVGGYQTYKKWFIPLFFFSIRDIYLPILVIMAYADETFTMSPIKKAVAMGKYIFFYGMLISLLGYFTFKQSLSLILVMICMPLLHETLFIINKRLEIKNK